MREVHGRYPARAVSCAEPWRLFKQNGRCQCTRDEEKVVALMGAWVAVAVGGAMGSVARFWLTSAMTALTGPRFPWGTLLINVLGSFVIGLVAGVTLIPSRVGVHPDIRIFLMTGVCGGFTTFSAFSLQTLELMQAGDMVPALGYAMSSVVFCVAATFCGWALGRL
jgi:fluoride exporter